jgi:hypothetical protein
MSINTKSPDGVYERFIRAHDGLSDDQSAKLNARLVLCLANHIGDEEAIADAIALAAKSLESGDER